jgi:hypothetical protein
VACDGEPEAKSVVVGPDYKLTLIIEDVQEQPGWHKHTLVKRESDGKILHRTVVHLYAHHWADTFAEGFEMGYNHRDQEFQAAMQRWKEYDVENIPQEPESIHRTSHDLVGPRWLPAPVEGGDQSAQDQAETRTTSDTPGCPYFGGTGPCSCGYCT